MAWRWPRYFGDGELKADDVAAGLIGAVVKDPVQDRVVWHEYLETVVKERDGWKDLYRAAVRCYRVHLLCPRISLGFATTGRARALPAPGLGGGEARRGAHRGPA